jgi:hypothetical protein
MRFKLFLLACFAPILLAVIYFLAKEYFAVDHSHFHAGFVVYIDGKKQDYSGNEHMHFDPCSITEKQEHKVMSLRDRIHLHDNNGDVAHSHADQVTWRQLLENSDIRLPLEKKLTAYRNGSKVESLLDSYIKPYDSVIFVLGQDIPIDAHNYVTRKRIDQVEKQSNYCDK